MSPATDSEVFLLLKVVLLASYCAVISCCALSHFPFEKGLIDVEVELSRLKEKRSKVQEASDKLMAQMTVRCLTIGRCEREFMYSPILDLFVIFLSISL